MPIDQALHFAEITVKIIEILGAAVIVGGTGLASWIYLRDGHRSGDWREAYTSLRSNLGRSILLGLELLVGADIIATITAPLSLESVGLLGGVILIRTFLSFALETEIEGCWPWRRAKQEQQTAEAEEPR